MLHPGTGALGGGSRARRRFDAESCREHDTLCAPNALYGQAKYALHQVLASFAALLDCDAEAPVNVASGVPVAVAEVAEMLGNIVGRTELVRLGALEARAGDPPRLVADTTRLNTEVGFRPRYDLRAGLADAVDWWRHRLG